MKRAKKLTSLFLAIALCFTTLSVAFPAFAIQANIDENGFYHRDVNGIEETFNTNFDAIVEDVYQDILAHKSSITIDFACPETSKYYFDLATADTDSQEYKNAKTKVMKLCTDTFLQALRVHRDDPLSGDYMYYNIILSDLPSFFEGDVRKNFDFIISPIKNDIVSQNIIDGTKYCQMSVTINNIHYYADDAVSQKVREALQKFKDYYITNNMTDYEKVKTIYDFVVRNTEYDTKTSQTHTNQIGTGDNFVDEERYILSHSVYGALFGNSSSEEFNWNKGNTVTTDNVLEQADQGLAVCEGYSKLFYALCTICGVDCHIIDGDYNANEDNYTPKDAHQWNEVKLFDEKTGTDKWYLVDTTFASQFSLKQIDFNSYRFFLRGRDFFENGNHQLPYKCESYDPNTNEKFVNDYNFQHETNGKYQYPLYDYYSSAYEPSTSDYNYPKTEFKKDEAAFGDETPFLICRSYTIEKDGVTEERGAYLLTNDKEKRMIEFRRNEENKIIAEETHVGQNGFIYNGQTTNTFEISIPYAVGGTIYLDEEQSKKFTDVNTNGEYFVKAVGKDGTEVDVKFNIVPLDMSYDEDKGENQDTNYDLKASDVQKDANYTGQNITPRAAIKDGFGNQLNKDADGKDFEIKIYSDPERTKPVIINDIGTYYISIEYHGNYFGEYKFKFTVGEMLLNEMKFEEKTLSYYPEGFRNGLIVDGNSVVIKTPNDYAIAFCKTLKYAEGKELELGKHYGISATGSLDYGNSIEVTYTALSNNGIVEAGTQKVVSYKIADQFDLEKAKILVNGVETPLNGFWAENQGAYSYTGNQVCPNDFGFLNQILKLGVDYEIVGYENNINASTNENPAYVVIKGINGCKGTIKMKFAIVDRREQISLGSYSFVNEVFTYNITSNGKTLIKGVDYEESFIPYLSITGKGNYRGTINITSVNYNNVYPPAPVQIPTFTPQVPAPSPTPAVTTPAPTATTTVKTPKATTLSKVTVSGKKQIKVTWKKQTSNVKGYQIQIATDSKFKKNAKTFKFTSNKITSCTIKSLKKGNKYYVRVRTYNGNKYSSWSKSKLSAKVK